MILKFKKKYCQNRREKLHRTIYISANSEFHATTLLGQGQIEPLPARFEKSEPVHRITGKIFFKSGNYPVSVNLATALVKATKSNFIKLIGQLCIMCYRHSTIYRLLMS